MFEAGNGTMRAMEMIAAFIALMVLVGFFTLTSRVYRILKTARAANERLEAVEKQLAEMNQRGAATVQLLRDLNAHAAEANTMHGDLNRAAQWLMDRESEKVAVAE